MVDGTDHAQAFFPVTGPLRPTHVSHKQVQAAPIAAAEFERHGNGKVALKGGAIIQVPPGFASRGAPSEGDMLVRYAPTENEPDGYLSHSPRAAFDAGYSEIRHHGRGLTFGQAIEQLKAGDRVARDGWNGKGMFLLLWPAGAMGGTDLPGEAWCPPFITIATAESPPSSEFATVVRPWNASQADILAEDWAVVSGEPARDAPRVGAQDTRSRGEPRP